MAARAIKIAGTATVVVRLRLSLFAGMLASVDHFFSLRRAAPQSVFGAFGENFLLAVATNYMVPSRFARNAYKPSLFMQFQWHLPCLFADI
jgi:hypothetical protein